MISISDLHGLRLNSDERNKSQSYVHHLKELGYIAMELSLNVREVRERVADHKIEEFIGVGGQITQRDIKYNCKALFLRHCSKTIGIKNLN